MRGLSSFVSACVMYILVWPCRLSGGYREVWVGTWERAVEAESIDEAAVRWAWAAGAPDTVPESVCSHACRPGEFRIQLEQKCCWECRRCRNNEIVTLNGTSCVECDVLYWPDSDNASVCLPITPTSYTWRHTVSLLGVSVSVVGAALCVVVFVFYVYHRDRRLIKATNRELSVVGLVGAVIAYGSAILMMGPPTTASCGLSHIGIHLGFCVTYACLLTVGCRS